MMVRVVSRGLRGTLSPGGGGKMEGRRPFHGNHLLLFTCVVAPVPYVSSQHSKYAKCVILPCFVDKVAEA